MAGRDTYTGTPGTPGLAATEPLTNPRMLMLWNALEGIRASSTRRA